MNMMSYDSESGSFPFSKNELNILNMIACERLGEMRNDFENKDPHKFVELCQIEAKLSAYIFAMNNKGIASEVYESEEAD
ncbi:hypothetical protein H8S37_04205 [Mediterraneibacter sp. NSJ-55]|uniref:Uncharacterized protein n=1 Tax=Mediterraneibacter hominis TaxID=2763054 RepID=A0A923LGE1_9FIRM|nr:hypothetical protein [Mediterraneibacter hominis]MBC5688136.1 hypothetical protein [Mediterraneibacter hominis]